MYRRLNLVPATYSGKVVGEIRKPANLSRLSILLGPTGVIQPHKFSVGLDPSGNAM
jgi:hypothetical protein